jgi:glutathione S-transferase
MSLTLHFHPLSSYCHKVLIALYENGTPFTPQIVNLGDAANRAALTAMWPIGKIPVLRDEAADLAIPEASVIIEYLQTHHPGAATFIPAGPDMARETRLWDRIFDHYVHTPMQKIVGDRLRPEGAKDAFGVEDSLRILGVAYDMIEARLGEQGRRGRVWIAGEGFTLADCAATPALFYAQCIRPFAATHPHVARYFDRLLARPAVARTLEEAKPYFRFFPMKEALPARFTA